MGTTVEVTVVHENESFARETIEKAQKEADRLESILSTYNKDSELSALNREGAFRKVKVSPELFFVIEQSIFFSSLTEGAFQITIGPLSELWGFSEGQKRKPSYKEIEKILALIDFRKIKLDKDDRSVSFQENGMKLDVNAIGKGYVVDRMIAVLRKLGIKGALVNAGGDLYALGKPEGRESWTVGIRDPSKNEEITDVLNVKDRAVATSGNYENFFILNGEKYTHIIDPRNGYPVRGLASVTVIAETAMEADTLATAFFVMGEENGKKLANQLDGVEAIFIRDNLSS